MNSLSALANIGTPPSSSPPSRTASLANILESRSNESRSSNDATSRILISSEKGKMGGRNGEGSATELTAPKYNEKTPLLSQATKGSYDDTKLQRRWLCPKRISDGVIAIMRVIATPFVYTGQCLVACFYYEDGHFSLLAPLSHITRFFTRGRRKKNKTQSLKLSGYGYNGETAIRKRRTSSITQSRVTTSTRRSLSIASTSTAVASDSDSERPPSRDEEPDSPSRHTRSKSNASTASSVGDEIAPRKRSIRIKLHNEEALRQRKSSRQSSSSSSKSSAISPEAAALLKSPTGPVIAPSKQLTRLPQVPQPPRPLMPRRQPSHSSSGPSAFGPHQKTLIIDLDETLIHSMAKGGRFQTGHMVEVKLQASVGSGGQVIGPSVPILYYVHKRPYCDEFLKKVSKWYNLIIFTASVQEYADPVIDWLEVERKYFAARYYRQHCTFRNGAYIKDLTQVEPDLSKVIILDNSPVSYVFHPDNAIPIEGWISDPTDNDLMHLIPLLEGLQYVTDVRTLLALRMGMPTMA